MADFSMDLDLIDKDLLIKAIDKIMGYPTVRDSGISRTFLEIIENLQSIQEE